MSGLSCSGGWHTAGVLDRFPRTDPKHKPGANLAGFSILFLPSCGGVTGELPPKRPSWIEAHLFQPLWRPTPPPLGHSLCIQHISTPSPVARHGALCPPAVSSAERSRTAYPLSAVCFYYYQEERSRDGFHAILFILLGLESVKEEEAPHCARAPQLKEAGVHSGKPSA